MCSRYAAYQHAASETEWFGDATAGSGKGTLLVARCVKGHFHKLCGDYLIPNASQHRGVCLPGCDACPEQHKLRSGTASCDNRSTLLARGEDAADYSQRCASCYNSAPQAYTDRRTGLKQYNVGNISSSS